MRYAFALLLTALPAAAALGAVKTEPIEYRHGDTVLEGHLAYDDAIEGKLPGVLVVPEWWGLGRHARESAERLAGMGYVAFAVDMYGKGRLTDDFEQAAEWAMPFREDRQLMRDRVRAGLDVLLRQDRVDGGRIGAIGFCFGGTTVLELARSGAEVAGVVSFHGGLGTPHPGDARQIQGRVLVLHGADDPYVPQEELDGFVKEMRDASADWQLNMYGGAVHSYTNPEAGDDPSQGFAYDREASERSWEATRAFFADVFRR